MQLLSLQRTVNCMAEAHKRDVQKLKLLILGAFGFIRKFVIIFEV